MYGGGGGTSLGGHIQGPCQASRLPPHNPRLHVPPKHGHVRQPSHSQKSHNNSVAVHTLLDISWKWMHGRWEEEAKGGLQ